MFFNTLLFNLFRNCVAPHGWIFSLNLQNLIDLILLINSGATHYLPLQIILTTVHSGVNYPNVSYDFACR